MLRRYFRKRARPPAAEGKSGVLKRADQARDRRDVAAAAALYREILDRWGPDHGILMQLGNALKDGGAYESAEQIYRTALHLLPLDADTHLQLGHLSKLSGDKVRAGEFYREANRLDPALPGPREELEQIEAGNVAVQTPPPKPPPPAIYAMPVQTAAIDWSDRQAVVRQQLVVQLRWRRD